MNVTNQQAEAAYLREQFPEPVKIEGVPELVKAIKHFNVTYNEAERLITDFINAQRDKLLAALNDVIEMANAYEFEYAEANVNYNKDVQEDNKQRVIRARAAIAKTEADK